MHRHMHAHTHPLRRTNTPFCPLPFPNPIMLTSLKNICSNGLGSKAISCVLQPPHLQIPTHSNTEGCLCAAGCYFYPHYGGQSQDEGGLSVAWATANMSISSVAREWGHLVFTAECSQSSWNVNRLLSKVFTEDRALKTNNEIVP